jgi:ribonuclease Z
MSIAFDILGQPGRDNALLVRIDSGHALDRLLFDCGEGCLTPLSVGDVQAVDALFFSHLHMDHVAGFDMFFRCTYDRDAKPNVIYGPPETAAILQHRFRGYLWNLHESLRATWCVADVFPDRVVTRRFELAEEFAVAHEDGERPYDGILVDAPAYTVAACTMDHSTPSLAYVVREKPRWNVDIGRLPALGLRPGPWLKELKDPAPGQTTLEIQGVPHTLEALRRDLLVQTPGDSIAYLTDFLMDESALARLVPALRGCKTVVCESQYRPGDAELAVRNYHMTCTQAAELAARAGVGELVLFHVSDRYTPDGWREMLREAQAVFPRMRFPESWQPLAVSSSPLP